jgi:hypothetical protein
VFKRTFWFGTGVTAGFGGAMWIRRQVLRTVRRYTPEHVQADVTTSVKRLGADLRGALRDGRDAMADREAALRAELAPGAGRAREDAIGVGVAPGAAAGPAPGWGTPRGVHTPQH